MYLNNLMKVLAGTVLAAAAVTANATPGVAVGKVVKIFSTGTPQANGEPGLYYGGCMGYIGFDATGTGCDNFISFGCDGAHGFSKDVALRNFSAVQLAMVTDTEVQVHYDNVVTVNKIFCVANRVDVVPAN